MKRKNRKAQFYLVAAIVLIVVIAAFVTIANYSRKKNAPTIYDLSEELGIESQNIIDYGTANEEDIDELLNNFLEDYANYAGKDKNLYFLFGNPGEIQVKAYNDLQDVSSEIVYSHDSEQVIVTIDDVEYQFDLAEGYGFYFVVSQEISGEKYVITG